MNNPLANRPFPSIRDFYAGRLFPSQQVRACQNIDKFFPTRNINSGATPSSLDKSPYSLDTLSFESDSKTIDLFDYVSRNRIAGLLVLKNDKVVVENYEYGSTPDTRWMSMSMAKSISTTLVGAAIADGYIKNIDELLVTYLPSLKGGSYSQVTIRQLLLMSSGVIWNEDSTNLNSNRHAVLELQIAQKKGAILDYMSGLKQVANPGEKWNYSTGETHLVGELLKATTGKWLADYLSEKIWSKQGMQSDASWWLETKDGLEVAGSGISATLRDYGRFGLFIQNGGVIGSQAVLPEGWLNQASGPTDIGEKREPYGYMWWSVANAKQSYADGAFAARGIFGQRLYINPKTKLVIVVLAARSKPLGDEGVTDNDFFNAVNKAL